MGEPIRCDNQDCSRDMVWSYQGPDREWEHYCAECWYKRFPDSSDPRDRGDRRERIATAAMQGLVASANGANGPTVSPKPCAKEAVEYADALIAELDKPKEAPEGT